MKPAFPRSPAGLGSTGCLLLLAVLSLGLVTAVGAQTPPLQLFPAVPAPEDITRETPPPPETLSPAPTPAPHAGISSEDMSPPGQPIPPGETPLFYPKEPLASLALDSAVPEGWADCGTEKLFLWDEKVCLIGLPGSLLWKPPLANQREPRMFVKLNNALDQNITIDTAIGAQMGLLRLAPEHPFEGFQFDLFAAVFTRFDGGVLNAADYRVGPALTYAKGPWSGKLSYEHSSSHLGDEFIEANPGIQIQSFVRDEMVLAASRYFFDNALRFYGQVGAAIGKRYPPGGRLRYDLGSEYVHPVTLRFPGNPFAAIDFDFRPEYDYQANTTIQVGWRFIHPESRRAVRVALEYYNGGSPYGKFFRQSEDWIGVSAFYDW